MKTLRTTIALVAAVAIALGWLTWECVHDPKINFLPRDGRAEWIIFPAAINARTHQVATMDATFRRAFTLESQPGSARLLVRAAKRVEIKINGEKVPTVPSRNWKQLSTLEVANFLRNGPNTIEARVFNDDAPPALWLALTSDSSTLRTDEKWEVSLAGSASRNSALASTPQHPGPGNSLAGGETIADVLPRIWQTWIVFGIVAVLMTITLNRWTERNGREGDFPRNELFGLLGLCILAWLILFWNNAKMLPFQSGYDSKDHLAYIKYIQERGALPMPNEGYEMFQPPLYYALSAGVLSIFHLATADIGAVAVLRALTMIFGVANFILVFLSVRLLFPGRRGLQLIGLLIAAFLPMQLYLSHYVTNETLAATLASATIYFTLRVLKSERASIWLYLWLGFFSGTALLAKATSLLLVPPLIGALMIKLLQQRASIFAWLRTLGITIVALLITCGWYYIRIWRHFGTPFVGNWEPVSGFSWWQDPGFHTAGDYFRFGQALTAPLFSGFNGFADGIYSTLWGDGLCSGSTGVFARTPWNYPLVIGGYWVALIPTLLVLAGIAVTLCRFARHPSAEWFLLIGFSSALAVALVFMTLRVASYAQVKAFYGLSAVIPFCTFTAAGWELVARRQSMIRTSLTVFLIFWGLNSFASVWILGSARQHMYTATRLISTQQAQAALEEAAKATALEPTNPSARWLLGVVLEKGDERDKAMDEARTGIQLDPSNGDCHLLLGITLGQRRQLSEALTEAQRALELQPENSPAHDLVFALTGDLHRTDEALTIGRNALSVSPFDSDLHYRVGLAAGEVGDFTTAAHQFAYSLLLYPKHSEAANKLHLALRFAAQASNASSQLKAIASAPPDSAPLLNELAWLFATHPDAALRDGPRAVQLSERACALTDRKQPALLATAAVAHAEAGKFGQAIATAQEALSIARLNGDAETVELCEKILTAFQSDQPYREEPRP